MAASIGGQRWAHMRNRVMFASVCAGLIGAIYGQVKRAQAHWNFGQQLENPTGFIQALENVNVRTGGTKPLGFTILGAERRAAAVEQQSNANDSGMVQESQESERWHSSERAAVSTGEAPSQSMSTQAPIQTPPVPQEPTTSRPTTRWDEIRMANARGSAKDSSWEALRQSHERDRVSEASPSPPDIYDNNQQQQQQQQQQKLQQHQPSGTLRDQERTKEQAKFDALLEAERKMSRG
ncbi:hypothetical protein NLI96_g1355 [Meripilus lineatus]|uniref:Uncharacterized protein n=1 Tax=Meripilus lineatus TaxID=2056292 RepID=A0AAD5VD35_9APHY|nr:hypothetical protein NLI96_g1355 [Physisporinus lineatus]